MDTTLTQRDKALLLILAIIIIIFAAVLIPKVGIYALITNRNDLKEQINKQKAENQQLFLELIESGISGAFAENGAMAKSYLNKILLNEIHKAAKLSAVVNTSNSYMTARDWINPIKYKGFVSGETEYFESINVDPSSNGVRESVITIHDMQFTVNIYEAEVEAELSVDNTFSFNTSYCENAEYLGDLASMIVLSSQLSRRGSCIIQIFEYSKLEMEDEAMGTVKITVLVITPVNADLAEFANLVCECHNCGTPYYKDDLRAKLEESEGAGYACTLCGEILDETTLG